MNNRLITWLMVLILVLTLIVAALVLHPGGKKPAQESTPPQETTAAAAAETKAPTPVPTPEPSKAPAELSFDDVKQLIQEAMDLYCGIFLWQDTVDHNDSIPSGSDQFPAYYRVTEVNSMDALRQLCRKHYTDTVTERIIGYHEWLEQDGKLYVSQSMGLGGPTAERMDVSFRRVSDTQYSVHIIGYATGASGLMKWGEDDVLLDYVDGFWVWETTFSDSGAEINPA